MGMNDTRIKPIIHRFDSVTEAVEAASKGRDKRASSSTAERNFGGYGWYETESFEDACKLAVDGWDGIREDLSELVKEVSAEVQETISTRWEPRWDVEGAVVDIEAFNNGEPDCMVSFEATEATETKPVVTVLVNTCFSGGFSASQMVTRGAGICGLVEVLMSLGYSVEVWAETADGPKGGQWWDCLVKVKGADEYVDMDRIAFVIGHPSWLRRIMFGLMEGETDVVRRRFGFGLGGGGYGAVGKLQMAEEIGADITVEGALLGRDYSRTAVGWVKDALRQIGVTAVGEE